MANKALDIIIKAHDRASKEFKQLRSELDALNQAGSNMRDLGRTFMGVGMGLGSGLAYAVKITGDFEQAVANVGAVMGRQAGDWEDIAKVAREYGRTTSFTATESANAMQLIAQYGYNLKDTAKIMKTTTKLATAQQYDLAMATDIVIATFKNFERQGYSVAKVGDILAQASNISSASMDKFRYSMKYVAPVANSLGISLEDVTAQLALLYDAGLPAETAGTSLRMAYSRLLGPTKKAADVLKSYGITLDEVNPKTNKMADIMDTLREAGVSTNDMFTIFGVETAPAMIAMMERGGDALRDYEEKLKSAGGTVEKMYNTQMSTFNNRLRLLKSNIEELALSVGEILLPVLEKLIDYLQRGVDWLNGLSDGSKKAITYGLLVGSALFFVAGAVLYLGGAFLTAVASIKEFVALVGGAIGVMKRWKWIQTVVGWLTRLRTAFAGIGAVMRPAIQIFSKMGQIGWIILGVIAILAIFYVAWKNNWFGIRDITKKVWDWLVGIFDSIVQKGEEMVQSMMDWWAGVDILGSLQSAWNGVVEWFAQLWQSIKDTIHDFLLQILMDTGQSSEEAQQTLTQAWQNIKTAISTILDELYWFFIGRWIEMGQQALEGAQAIKEYVVQKLTELKEWAMPYWEAFKAMVIEAWNQIKAYVSPYIQGIKEEVTTSWETIKSVTEIVWNTLKTIISGAMQVMSSIINLILGSISASWKATWNGIKAYFSSLWNSIKTIVNSAMNILKNIIALGVNLIAGNWSKAWENVKNIVKNAWTIIKEAVSSHLKAIEKAITSFKGSIKRSGKALMDAFAQGIKSGATKVVGAVKGVVSEARKYFGFSDAKKGPFSNITYSGFATMSAFARGATQARSMLAKKVGGTLSSALSGTTAGSYGISQVNRLATASPSDPAPAPIINLTFNVYGNVDEKSLAKTVMAEIQKQMRR